MRVYQFSACSNDEEPYVHIDYSEADGWHRPPNRRVAVFPISIWYHEHGKGVMDRIIVMIEKPVVDGDGDAPVRFVVVEG